jgi:hypothetical protein
MVSDDTNEMKIEFTTEFPTYTTDKTTATCLVSLVARNVDEDKRAPVSMTLVLDRSGSMSGSKLRLVKKACLFLLKHLNARDSVSIIDFGSDVRSSLFCPAPISTSETLQLCHCIFDINILASQKNGE